MSKARYADTWLGRLGFERTEVNGGAYVQVWRANGPSLGLWRIDRFGGVLNAKGIRLWEQFVKGEQTHGAP